jgi:hypothetical protein
LPRDLADVLHYFLPELQPDEPAPSSELSPFPNPRDPDALSAPDTTEAHDIPDVPDIADETRRFDTGESRIARPDSVPPLPILGIPMGDRDVVRAALTWNLAVETARLGGGAVVLAPLEDADSALWPEPGVGPLGAELCFCPAETSDDLYRTAAELAAEHAHKSRGGGIVFVRIPSRWLEAAISAPLVQPFRWLLLLTSSGRRDLKEAFDLSKTLLKSNERVEIGITIHGVRSINEARNAFERLHREAERQLGLSLFSYGLLVDDLHVYRAIAAQRPIGLAHPQAPATRALMDVAQLLYEDARSRVLG